MTKHALVIFNPVAKSPVHVEQWMSQVIQELNKLDEFIVSFYPTTADTRPEDLVPMVIPPLDLIIAAGGDGTVRFALAALAKAKSEIPVAIFPLGTGNVLARNLGIMEDQLFANPLQHAYDYIVNGCPLRIDMAMMNGEYFAGMAGVGPISDAFMTPGRSAKTHFKIIAYLKALLATIAKPPHVFKITTAGRSFKVQASGIFVGNVEDFGVGTTAELHALTDGVLDLHVINPKCFQDYVDLGFRYMGGNRNDHVVDYALRVKEVMVEIVLRRGVRSTFQNLGVKLNALFTGKTHIDAARGTELACMIDGEECGITPMRITVIPQAVNVLVSPAKYAEFVRTDAVAPAPLDIAS